MRPKWMLTHPDGRPMIVKAMEGLDWSDFDRIIVTIVKPHDEKYEALLFLRQVFAECPKVEICVLDDFTSSASETVALTLRKMNVSGSFVIKDSDNFVKIKMANYAHDFVVCYDITKYHEVENISGKSFLIVNDQNIIQDIVEKKIVSNIICIGVYGFSDADGFLGAYDQLKTVIDGSVREMYISHVISYMLFKRNAVFMAVRAEDYEDWGTWAQWRKEQEKYRTYFVDVDGVILKNSGQYGGVNWSNNVTFLDDNVKTLCELQNNGAQIILTTSRSENYRKSLEALLALKGLRPHAILMGMNHSARILINDFAATNPYPSAIAVSLPRNANLREYLNPRI
jgi:hypothetical protein